MRRSFEQRQVDFYIRQLRRIAGAKLVDADGLRQFAVDGLKQGRLRMAREQKRQEELAALAPADSVQVRP